MSMPEEGVPPVGSGVGAMEVPNVIIQEQIRIAQPLAAEIHAGQTYDKVCGESFYDGHLVPVAANGERLCQITGQSRLVVPALWLHDGVEDGRATLEEMGERGIISPVLRIVDLLTRDRQHQTYRQYMRGIVDDPEAALGKLADSLANVQVNLQFHDHESPSRVQKRLLRYPRNISLLAPVVFEAEMPDSTPELEEIARDPDTALAAFVGALRALKETVAFDPSVSNDEVEQRLLIESRQAAFLAPVVLGESVQPDLIREIRTAVLA